MINTADILPAAALTGQELVLMEQGGSIVKAPLYDVINTPAGTYATAPTGFTSTAFDANQIDLSWSGTADNYILESCREDNGAWQQIYSGASTSFSDLLLYPEEHYYYRVKAQVAGEWDSAWEYADETTPPA